MLFVSTRKLWQTEISTPHIIIGRRIFVRLVAGSRCALCALFTLDAACFHDDDGDLI